MEGGLVNVCTALALVAAGCATVTTGAADCSSQVRLEGMVYTSHGYTDRKATKYAAADAAECHDVGANAAGSVFPKRPRQVTTGTFRGYPPEEVLGVRFDQDSFTVFVADSVSPGERERIFRELQQPAG